MSQIHSAGRYWIQFEGDRENVDGTFGVKVEFTGEELKALLVLVKERAEDRVRMARS